MKMLLLFAVAALAAFAQTAEPRPEFDAASIRLNTAGGPIVFNGMESLGTFASVNQTLRNLVQEAYGHPAGRRNWLPYFKASGQSVPILGGPSWFGDDRWNITAKWNAEPAGGHITMKLVETEQARMELMLRTLLEQRFQLRLHRETRDLPVYELTLANPRKLKQTNCTVFDPDNFTPSEPGQPPADYCGSSREGRRGMDWTFNGQGIKMVDLATTLTYLIGARPIVDKTGFTGTFDAHLRWTPGPSETGGTVPPSPDDVNESIFTVLQDQLGLKLKTGKAPVEVIVIDSVEKPTPN
jgi:uncharacterized protein (TIGR03435 family)